MKERYMVGIDCGVNTGIAVWDRQKKCFEIIQSTMIHRAFKLVLQYHERYAVFVRIEDARKRRYFGNTGREMLQGAGSVKRDAKIWEDFCLDMGIRYELVPPKNNKTKLNSDLFERMTGWKNRTNNHARDAAMLIYGF